ncbi:MAG: tetratricopeptide repeat protein [bacterium]
MKVRCPKCKTVHSVDEKSLTDESIVVKCASCETKFRVKKKKKGDAGKKEVPAQKKPEVSSDTPDSVFSDIDSEENNSSQNEEIGTINDMDDSLDLESHRYVSNSEDDEGSSSKVNLDDFKERDDIGSEKTEQIDLEDMNLSGEEEEGSSGDPLFEDDSLNDEKSSDYEENSSRDDDSEDDFLKDLFSDSPEDDSEDNSKDDLQQRLMRESADNAEKESEEDIFKDSPASGSGISMTEDAGGDNDDEKLYLKRSSSGEILGPFDREEFDRMVMKGEVESEDMISIDGKNWNMISDEGGVGSDRAEPSIDKKDTLDEFDPDAKTSINTKSTKSGLGVNSKDDIFSNSPSFDEDETRFSVDSTRKKIKHTYIPEEDTTSPSDSVSSKGSSGWLMVFVKLLVFMFVAGALAGGGYFAYTKYTAEKDSFFDQIRETVTGVSGTLIDVRESLEKDRLEDYMRSLGILKKHGKDEIIPVIAGLDAQVKYNMLYSYGKVVEPVDKIHGRISSVYEKNSDNIDVSKGMAWSYFFMEDYEKAAEVLAPFVEKEDPEIYYILGVATNRKGSIKDAEMFLKKALLNAGENNCKIPYELADINFKKGDYESALAYINRTTESNPRYFRAVIKKAEILLNGERKKQVALNFLKNVDKGVLNSAEDSLKARYYFILSSIYQSREQYKKAIKLVDKALEISGNSKRYLTHLADLYRDTRSYEKAVDVLGRVQKIDKTHAPAIVKRAEIFLTLKQLENVFLEISKLNEDEIKDPKLLLSIGKILKEIGENENAMNFFDRVIKENPSYTEAYLEKSLILIERGELDKVSEISGKIREVGEKSYVYHLIQGILSHKKGDFSDSEQWFNRAIKNKTENNPLLNYHFGRLLLDMEKYSAAVKQFSKASKRAPENFMYKQELALALEKSGQYREVIKLLSEESIEDYNRKDFYRSFEIMSDAYYYLGEYKKALSRIEKAMDVYSRSSHLYFKKARILYELNELARAEEAISTAVMLDMKNFNNYMMYAKILIKREDYKGAVDKINEAELIDPENKRLYLIKGMAFKEMSDYNKALAYFNKIDASSPLLKEAYSAIGKCHLELGNRKKAKNYMLKAYNRGSKDVFYDLARIYYEEGNIRKSGEFYRKNLKYNKNHAESLKRLGYINKESGNFDQSLYYFRRYLPIVQDPSEKKMIEEELRFLKNRVSRRKYSKIMDNVEDYTEEGVSKGTLKKAKQLYMKGKIMQKNDPEAAKQNFREVMKILPKENEYYKKAFKAFKE